jgi:Peptidase M30/PKD domain
MNVNHLYQGCLKAAALALCLSALTACGGGGGSSGSGTPVNTPPIASAGNAQSVVVGDAVTLDASASSDADGDAMTYAWVLTVKPATSAAVISVNVANSAKANFTADKAGSYTATVTVTDGKGGSSIASVNVVAVQAKIVSTFNGTGIGVWSYNNKSTIDTSINLDIANVAPGKRITLAFTNGSNTQANTVPSVGAQASFSPLVKPSLLAEIAPRSAKDQMHQQHDEAHHQMLGKNTQTLARLQLNKPPGVFAEVASPTPALFTPALNASRAWVDYFDATPVSYNTTNKFVCSLPSGRNVVFWQDNLDTNMTPAHLATFTNAACGPTGGFARINDQIGDAWGANNYSNLIKDSATTLQDINVVFLKPAALNWAGYFYSRNNFVSTATYPSNEALAFFVNTTQIPTSTNYYVSTLFHEATHMVNYYQNNIKLGKTRQAWLEETTAMMTEDFVTPAVTATSSAPGYNKISDYRLPNFLSLGGNISLNNWPTLASANGHYNMGGSFGAFLNRQYGLNIYKQLVSGCTSSTTINDSYACLDSVIINNGGLGVKEELARFGATVYGLLPSAASPAGYGFTSKTDGIYTFAPINLPNLVLSSPSLMTVYGSMSQTYLNETMAIGTTRYVRNGVIVPAGTTLQIVIQ